ncbi:MAG: ATP-binding protein, partial [Candidatus Nealsonbacteria bacterium]
MLTASGLIGGVFLEEERQLTHLYDAVLRLLADGYWSSKIITAKLYDMGLISAPNPGIVTGI